MMNCPHCNTHKHGFRVRRIGPFRFVKWTKEAIIDSIAKYKRYPFDFYGIGIGGYYIGFLDSRLRRK